MEAEMLKNGYFVVEEILGLKEHPKKNPYLPELLVKWDGYEDPTWEKLNVLLCPGATADEMVIDFVHDQFPQLEIYIDKVNGRRRFSIANREEVDAQVERGEWDMVDDIDAKVKSAKQPKMNKTRTANAAVRKSSRGKVPIADVDEEVTETPIVKKARRSTAGVEKSPNVSVADEKGGFHPVARSSGDGNGGGKVGKHVVQGQQEMKFHKHMKFCGWDGFVVSEKCLPKFKKVMVLQDFNLSNKQILAQIKACLFGQYGEERVLKLDKDDNGFIFGKVVKNV